ncbi:MAG: response regulator [Myxococcota bacterium]
MPRARILAVDDQRYFRELIEGLLTGEGYTVRTASSGEEALHVLEREDFDVIITDLVMPGIDGSQLVAAVKERNPDQDMVMVTGVVDVKTAVDAMKQGATDYILKPFDRNTLTRSLDTILQRRRLHEEHARLMAENLEYMEVLSLYERAAGLFSTLSTQPLAERLIEGLCLETRAQSGVLWLAEDVGEPRLWLASARGLVHLDEENEELDADALGPELAPLVREGRSLTLPTPRGGGTGGALYVPLRHAGGLVGLARLGDKLEGDDFGEHDRAAAEKFVSLGAVAVANALRFRALERRSFRDPTTKAYTYAYFEDVVRNEIQKASRFDRQFSLVRVDLGSLGELRRSAGESELGLWLESVVHHVSRVLRSTDLVAVESDRRFAVLLPETDALGGAVLKERIERAIEESGVLDSMRQDSRRELTLAVATFPTDGTQLEALARVLDRRVEEEKSSLLRALDLQDLKFGDAVEALMEEASHAPAETPGEIARFLLEEVRRRPNDRGMLVVSPGPELTPMVEQEIERLTGVDSGIEVVVVGDGDGTRGASLPVTWVDPDRAGTERRFALYYGDGPAYAMLADVQDGAREWPLFHTSDRALVEHLAFRLQRDLGVSLGF